MLHKKILKKIKQYFDEGASNTSKNKQVDGAKWPALSRLYREADLRLLDIGGRFGPLSPFARIENQLHLYICEADKVEADRLTEEYSKKSPYRKFSVIADAIYESRGEQTLYLTKKRGLSSLYNPNFKEIDTYFSGQVYEKWKVDEKLKLPTITLDEAAKRYGMSDISFMKLDTQGSELPIMRSGESLLDSVLGVYIEIEIKQFYENQPILGEVQSFLEKKGFVLFDLVPASSRRITKTKAPYSKSELLWFHALYFKAPNTVLSKKNALKEKMRLASYALCFDYFDLAISSIEDSEMKEHFKDAHQEILSEVISLSADSKK